MAEEKSESVQTGPTTAYGVLRMIEVVVETEQDEPEGQVKAVKKLCRDWFAAHPWEKLK